jgi:hypothetical protein
MVEKLPPVLNICRRLLFGVGGERAQGLDDKPTIGMGKAFKIKVRNP